MLQRDWYNFEDMHTESWVKYMRKNDPKWYQLFPGSRAIVDPVSKAKGTEKVRGRECIVLWIGGIHSNKVGIRYLDSDRYGERYPQDLIPLPTKPIDLSEYRRKQKKIS